MTSRKASLAPPDGLYEAIVERAKVGKVTFSDGEDLHYVELRFQILNGDHRGRLFEWREWLTAGAMPILAPALIACGARLRDGDPSDLEGSVGTKVAIELFTISCVEAPGVVKTCVEVIRGLGSSPGGDSKDP